MKTLITALTIVFASLSVNAQTFELKYATLEKYLMQDYSPEKVKSAIASSYSLVKQSETEWKFRDDSKTWEATLFVQLDNSTGKIKEIQFAAPQSRVFEYLDELEKNLGFKVVRTEGRVDVLENSTKKLGAKLVPASFLGQGMYLYRLYRL